MDDDAERCFVVRARRVGSRGPVARDRQPCGVWGADDIADKARTPAAEHQGSAG